MQKDLKFQLLPEDQVRITRLCGPVNSTLRQIEEALKIKISNRGSNFKIKGEKFGVESGKMVLLNLYERSSRDIEIKPEEVHLFLREVINSDGKENNNDLQELHSKIHLTTPNILVIPKGRHQIEYVETIRKKSLTFAIGPAGTGKTYLAVAAAVQKFAKGEVKRIVLVRPAVEAGEKLGFLPGDLSQKIDPYLKPLYDALFEMLGFREASRLIDRNTIEVLPLAFMRGRTLNNAFIILDESQNTTEEQMKMFLTRFGFGSTVVVTGDVTQIDLPKETISGLIHATKILQ